VTLQVRLVVPEGEIWAGAADKLVAKTLDGEIGLLSGHTPVLGILAAGSVVRILPQEPTADGGWLQAAVGTGFLSVAADRVSILARDAVLGADVDRAAVRAQLEVAMGDAQSGSGSEPAHVSYLRAQLRAAGEEA
jgi:F-type H+-transporting ATPase subunit epsilon